MYRSRAGTAVRAPIAARWLAAGALVALLAGCSTEPYAIEPTTNPPWGGGPAPELPVLDPPLSDQAHRVFLCYGKTVNSEADVLAKAEEVCGGGRLVLERQTAFWNGCSILQPTRISYICDPIEKTAAGD